ncbi:hypothetical protein GCM10011390_10250 [Aureimonas endophytica]|uniref:Uncharacterized protein n=1 Tax=Aureimonas endophytica TaxID=2027858 RepID=A0A917E1Q5_9HYPH|nr:hypothetical protein [Aureimonas endophytica]GGD93430.1 hypothetical protein GCM10011390_10250 [Aureimonas endophytica]
MNTAADIGAALTRHIQARSAAPDDAEIIRLIDDLLAAQGRTALDALAFVSLAESLAAATAILPADMAIGEAATPLATVVRLLSRAVETLEVVTGYAADGFSGAARNVN